MRITETERQGILKGLQQELSGTHAEVFLYGSRVDDELQGGDIDLVIRVSDRAVADRLRLRLHYMLAAIKTEIGEQKIDLSVKDGATLNEDPFWSQVLIGAILIGEFS